MLTQTYKTVLIKSGLAIVLLISAACSKNNTLNKKASETDEVVYDLGIKLNTESLAQDRIEVAQRINEGKSVNFKKLTDIFMFDQANEYARLSGQDLSADGIDANQVQYVTPAGFYDLLDSAKNKGPLLKKFAYESAIENLGEKSEILYNKEAVTLFHLVNESKMQCFSGTSMPN